MPGSDIEWTGLFLFGVGVFGAANHSVMRHWALWGVIGLDQFYLALLAAGALLMVASSPLAPWIERDTQDANRLGRVFRVVRGLLALGLLAVVVWTAAVSP